MGEARSFDSEGFVKLDVLRSVGEMVFAADDVGDLHFDVVDYVDEVEDPRAVWAAHGHVGVRPGVGEIERDGAADFVMHCDGLARRAEAQRPRVLVDHALVLQDFQIPLVDGSALALVVGAVVPAFLRALVPFEPEPAKSFVNASDRLLVVTLAVGILNAQNERAAGVTGMEPVEEGGAGPADMKEAGWRGGEADADV